jgi:glutamate-1-semialdehyde 2,1-aminomutase
LAREYTQRQKIVKFEGHFHGFNDYLAFNYWPVREQAWPNITPAVERLPRYNTEDVIVLPYNDFEKVKETFDKHGEEIAALIIEPINYNSGTIMPKEGYLELLRELTSKHGTVLIFDEVLSGFRTGADCAQGYLGVTPDLCTLGKAIGGGTPLSCFGGKRDIMEHVSPLGKAQHSGTYNGHLIEIMAGNAFFDIISDKEFYPHLLRNSETFYEELDALFKRLGIQARIQHKGARFSFYFGSVCEREISNYQDLIDNQWGLIDRFYGACLKHGIYFHTMMHHGLSSAHTEKDIDQALSGIEEALKELKKEGLETKEGAAAPF